MDSSTVIDELFDIRTAFYIGSYQQCISLSQKFTSSSQSAMALRDVMMHRAYIAQQKLNVPLGEIQSHSSIELQAVRLYAEYLNAGKDANRRQQVIDSMNDLLKKNMEVDELLWVPVLMAGQMHYCEEDFETALKVLNSSDSLECLSLAVQILLRMDRIDLAKKETRRMIQKDEDSIITQMTMAWVKMAAGGDKVREAYDAFGDLIDRNSLTALLLGNQAVCQILCGNFEEAETLLQQAIDRDPNNSNVLVNTMLLSQLRGKTPEITARYLRQIQDSQANAKPPLTPLVDEIERKEREFDQLATAYSPSVVG